MSITFDAASDSGNQTANDYAWFHDCGGGNRFLAVDVGLLSVPGTTVTGVAYNGTALSLLGARSTVSGAGRVECWGLVNPDAGSNVVSVNLSVAAATAGVAVSYAGVDQTTPTAGFSSAQATNGGSPADAKVVVTTTDANSWVHAAVAADDASVTAGQTARNNVTGAAGSAANEDTVAPDADAVSMTYTDVGALATWAMAGYALRPAPGGNGGAAVHHYRQQGMM